MNMIHSPMPGKISKILVRVGDFVKEQTVVMIHEAMKMENNIFAACKGKVSEILVKEGENVETNQALLRLE